MITTKELATFEGRSVKGTFTEDYDSFVATKMGEWEVGKDGNKFKRAFPYRNLESMRDVVAADIQASEVIDIRLLEFVVELDQIMTVIRMKRHPKLNP